MEGTQKVRPGYERGGNAPSILVNSKLDCKDCIYRYEPDNNVGQCSRFKMKPTHVLDGEKCKDKFSEKDL